MSCRDFSVSAEGAASFVRRAILLRRARGHKNEHAIEDAAGALGLTTRKVKSLLYGEVFKVPAQEHRRILRRWWADMDQQAAEMIAAGIEATKQAEAEWLAENQLSLPLETQCSEHLPRNSVSGVGGRRS